MTIEDLLARLLDAVGDDEAPTQPELEGLIWAFAFDGDAYEAFKLFVQQKREDLAANFHDVNGN